MGKLKNKYRKFKEWEKKPHQVAPLSEEQHECATCGTHFQGNYCPRCGQSAMIGRYSFKNAFLLFLDVWGLGNRGMFRSIRDLLLRPGYMIRDYLRGMQMAYYPPFKMFFLLSALALLIDTGLNIKGINRMEKREKEMKELVNGVNTEAKKAEPQEKKTSQTAGNPLTKEEKKKQAKEDFEQLTEKSNEWIDQHSSGLVLVFLLLFSLPLWLLFRHSPAIPDIRLSECFVAMVYISNMVTIYSIAPSLLCFSKNAELIWDIFAMLLVIVPIKQLSGYSYWSTTWRVAIAAITLITVIILLFFAVAYTYLYLNVN
jgi:hypothetical protein